MMVTKMKIIRWLYGHTMKDKIKKEFFRDKVEVDLIDDKMRV